MDKYIIFVPDSLFNIKNKFLCCVSYFNLETSFKNQGISVIKSSKIKGWKNKNKFNGIDSTFDYDTSPELNKLYIYLCGNLYFSDSNYTRYRLNLEKDLLLLICNYLGVKEINVDESRNNKTQTNMELSLDVSNVTTKLENSKMNEKNSKNDLKETYSIDVKTLLFEKDRETFEKALFNKIGLLNINYKEYYNICLKLKIFACKRFNLRMSTYTYHLEEEFKNSKIQTANLLLGNYGLGVSCNNSSVKSYSYNYNIVFYDNDELFFYNKLIDDSKTDIFVQLRKEYLINFKMNRLTDPKWGGDSTEILQAVENYTKEKNINDELEKWYNENPIDKENNPSNRSLLEGKCHWFKNETDVIKHLKNILPITI